MGVVNSKRQNSKKSAKAISPNDAPKILVYEALATFNRDFEKVLGDLERLRELCLFRRRWQRKFLKTWLATLEETRAWANFEVVEVLHQREEREWTHFGRIRQQWEEPSAAPADMLVSTKSRGRKSTAKNG